MSRCCLVLVALAAIASDWPQWRGANRDSVCQIKGLPDKLPETLKPRWKQDIGGGYGGIAVVGERVYVMDRQTRPKEVERVLCLDVKTGKQLWKHEYAVEYGKLDYGNGPRSTPTLHDGKVYTFGALGHLYCLDAKTGKVAWSRDTTKEYKGKPPTWGHACSPLIHDGRLYTQVSGEKVTFLALEAATGKLVWEMEGDPAGYCSPVPLTVNGRTCLALFTPKHVQGFAPRSGRVMWEVPFEGIQYGVSISDVVMADGVLLASNYWSGSKAFTVEKNGTKVVWEGKDLSLLMSTPLVKGKHVYALDRFEGLKCLEMATGKVLWKGEHITPRGSNPHASLVWVGDSDRALILNTPGELAMVELTPKGLKKLGKASVIGKTWAHPAFADGCVFARSDSEIVCVPLVGK